MAAEVNFSKLSPEELQKPFNETTVPKHKYTKAEIPIEQGLSKTTAIYMRSNNKSENPDKYVATGRTTKNELHILEKLQKCDKVMQISNKGIHNGQWKIFTPYKSGGDLLTFMNKHIHTGLDDNVITDIIRQIIEALVCIHTRGFAHLDFKSENIVIDEDNKITIIDFETAREVDKNDHLDINKVFGTKKYRSPELNLIIERKKFPSRINGFATDIYTISVIVNDMASISRNPSYYDKFITYIKENYNTITAQGLLNEFKRQFSHKNPSNASIVLNPPKNASIVPPTRNELMSNLKLLREQTQNSVTKGRISAIEKQLNDMKSMGGRRKSYKKSKKHRTKKHRTKKQRKQRTRRA